MNIRRSWPCLAIVSGCCLALHGSGLAQDFPDTIWIPVTFYDYHGLGTNNFEPAGSCGWPDFKGLVENKLSSDHKPVWTGKSTGCADKINQWFRPSGANSAATNSQFYYDTGDSIWKWTNLVGYSNPIFPNNRNEYVSTEYNPDYGNANIVVYDSLPFIYKPALGTGVYQFSRTGQGEPMFFWLDGKGYGEEPDGSGHNFYFTMELHWQFVYQPGLAFDFNGDDDVWAFVNDSLVMDLGGLHVPEAGSFRVDDFASTMGLVEGNQYSFRFFYAERKTSMSTILITTNLLSPPKITGLVVAVSDTTIEAGQRLPIPARLITDDNHRSIPPDSVNPATGRPFYSEVTWDLLSSTVQTGDSLSSNSGESVSFSGTKAFRTRLVVATYTNPKDGTVYRDTARITVVPAEDYKVWIEATSGSPFASVNDILPRTYADSTDASRAITLIQLDSAQQVAYAGAIVRDRYGNIKRVASNGQWQALSAPPATVTAAPTSGKAWEGTITRTGAGTDSVRAWEDSPRVLSGDTVRVVISAGTLLELRLVDTLGNIVTSIAMTTDDERVLRVEGRYSDNPNTWVDFPAQWGMTPVIPSANALPASDATNWTFSPTAPGSANLTVQNASGTRSATIPVTVTPAPPSRIEISILAGETPTAGQPFRAQVRIYNTDGLVPGLWCHPGAGQGTGNVGYQDVIAKDGQSPTVATDYETDSVNLRPDTSARVAQCFDGGYDTVFITLYYAPMSADSNHQIWVGLHGSTGYLEGHTDAFHLLPGPVDSIYLADGQGTPLPASMDLAAPTGILYGISMGVDAYGNSIGAVSSGWSGNGTLHAPSPGPSPNLFYTTSTVSTAENGCIIAAASDNPAARDSICLTIAAPPAYVTLALTRDISGNGLLDRIEVHFSKVVTIADTLPLTNIVVNYRSRTTNVPLTVGDAIGRNGTTSDSVFYIELTESNASQPQTGWVPTIQFSGVQDVLTTAVTCTDGAGPVIWKVTKHVASVDDPSKDIVTVTFSEDLDKTPGATDVPGNVFFVWVRNGDGTFTSVDTLLIGIDYFLVAQVENQARFQMINGKNLTETNWLSIRVLQNVTPPVIDNSVQGNAPNLNNRKAQVQIENPKLMVKAAPNPMIPNGLRRNDPTLTYHDPAEVAQWAYRENGTAFMVSVPLPSDKDMTLEGELLVYDLAGNLVHRRSSNGAIDLSLWRASWQGGTTQRFGVYWNGLNDQGMKAMPGVYRGLVKLTARYLDPSGQPKTERLNQVVAIGVRR